MSFIVHRRRYLDVTTCRQVAVRLSAENWLTSLVQRRFEKPTLYVSDKTIRGNFTCAEAENIGDGLIVGNNLS
jgi:hypothetical protein